LPKPRYVAVQFRYPLFQPCKLQPFLYAALLLLCIYAHLTLKDEDFESQISRLSGSVTI